MGWDFEGSRLASRLLANEWCVEISSNERAPNLIQINCFRLEGLNFLLENFNADAGRTLLVGGPPAPAACGLAHASANLICRLLQ